MSPNVTGEELREALKQVLKEELKNAKLSDPEQRKEIWKEAAKEVFRENAARFGWWSVKTIGAAVLLALVYAIAFVQGWTQ